MRLKVEFRELHFACSSNDLSELRKLISQGADVNARDSYSWSPLHHAVNETTDDSHLEVVYTLLSSSADVNARDETGGMALQLLVSKPGVSRTLKLLLEHGADVNARDDGGETPVFFAVTGGGLESVETLVESGADVNVVDKRTGSSLLHAACTNNVEKRMVKYLLECGLKTDALDYEGRTPLVDLLIYERAPVSTLRLMLKYSDVNAVEEVLDFTESDYWKVFLEHVAVLRGLGVAVNPSILKFIKRKKCYYRKLEHELKGAKGIKIDKLSFFEVLVGTERELENFVGNTKCSEWEEMFPIYGSRMMKNAGKGIERRRLVNELVVLLSEGLPIFGPKPKVIKDVLECLSSKDLSEMIDANIK